MPTEMLLKDVDHPLDLELKDLDQEIKEAGNKIKDKTQAGYIHSFETGAAVDGPGVRCAVFTTGCHFRCLYCHNPDTWKLKDGKYMSIDEVMAEILPYTKFLKRTGGVTISGGEPLVQWEFVGEIFRRCHEAGLHTALDTQGYLGDSVTDEWLLNADLVMLDIKAIDPEVHKLLTSMPLDNTLKFAERLARLKRPMWIRYVVVPGYTDGEADAEKIAAYVASLGDCVQRVETLPFHKLGEHKWHDMGLKYELDATQPPSKEVMEMIQSKFKKHGLTVV